MTKLHIGAPQWFPDTPQKENIASPLGEDDNKTWSDYYLEIGGKWMFPDESA